MVLAFGSAVVTAGGSCSFIVNGTNTSATVNANGHSVTFQDCAVAMSPNPLRTYGCTDSGGNSGIAFDNVLILTDNWSPVGAVDLTGLCVRTAGNYTIDGTGITALTVGAPGCDFFSDGSGKTLTVQNMPAGAQPIRCWCGCVTTTGNAVGALVNHPGPPDDY
jgi:hypothetical protein